MVLESLINPFKAEKKPGEMIALGFIYFLIAVFLSFLIFPNQPSLIAVFLTVIACIPLMYNLLIFEESKDIAMDSERGILKEHAKAIKVFLYLFIGITLSVVLLYVVLDSSITSPLFKAQMDTINTINKGGISPQLLNSTRSSIFTKILLNNLQVLLFTLLFSFLYGAGAIFIITWNASVIGVAVGNFIKKELVAITSNSLLFANFQAVSMGFLRYFLHGIPEMVSYFIAALAGGILSISLIRKEYMTQRFQKVLLDSLNLLMLSIAILVIAALLEVYVTPILF